MRVQDEAKITTEKQAAGRAFADVQDRRTECFNDAFSHISARIDGIYKELTTPPARADGAPAGGGGYMNLNLTNTDRPYDGGVRFSAIPPNKKYVAGGIKQLSGGEKVLAALALLLAVHSYRPSPFFVFDEARPLPIPAFLCPPCSARARTTTAAELNYKPAVDKCSP